MSKMWIVVMNDEGDFDVYHLDNFFESSDERVKTVVTHTFYNQVKDIPTSNPTHDECLLRISPVNIWLKGNNGVHDVIVFLCIKFEIKDNIFVFVAKDLEIKIFDNGSEIITEEVVLEIINQALREGISNDDMLDIQRNCKKATGFICELQTRLTN